MEAIEILLSQGKIRASGVSNFDVALLQRSHQKVTQASNQVPYSMVKRDIENDLIPFCIDHNIAIIAYSPLQRGLLTGKIKAGHAFKEGDHRPDTPYFKKDNIRKVNDFLEGIRPIAKEHGASLAQLVLNWTAVQPGITVVLAGARNEQQVRDNAKALSFRLSEEEINGINEALAQLHLVV
jgi:aryl-alcohol dehydrogenase-like predicted oxidoreductase